MIRLVCPVDPDHGRVLPLSGSDWGWYCPHVAHDGRRGVGATRAYFTTAEVEAGHPASVSPATVVPPSGRGAFMPSSTPDSEPVG
jgi:hypothetical protein